MFVKPLKYLQKALRTLITKVVGLFLSKKSCFTLLGVPSGVVSWRDLNPVIVNLGQTHKRCRPKTIHSSLAPQFQVEQGHPSRAFVVSLPRGISTPQGANLTNSGELIYELSEQFGIGQPDDHRLFRFDSDKFLPKITFYHEAVASLTGSRQSNYFHWLFDVLPRLHLLNQSGLHYDKIYIDNNTKLHRDTLQILGYREDQLIPATSEKYVSAAMMVVPSFLFFPRDDVPAWVCRFLRENFLFHLRRVRNKIKTPPFQKIYVSRQDADSRQISNESALIAFLEKYNFKVITLEGMSFMEQVKLFNEVEVVVAPHGAALANVVFCHPDTKIVEIFNPHYIYGLFWDICQAVGLDYYYTLGHDRRSLDSLKPPSAYNIVVDLDQLTQTFQLAGITP
ncbi:MAG: glycosyltransferase family 61 protein [Chlamydiota bacterium]